ncbi:MAG: hypothetical protein IJ630_09020 [Treponema sp.]|nr:hypothetical protein [Treponema sp.]
MNYTLLKRGGVYLTLLLSLSIFSCGEDTGLGSIVDTEDPVLDITYPPSGVTIRDEFVFGGKWSDDKSIKEINIEVLKINSDETKSSVYTTLAEITAAKGSNNTLGTWKINLDSYDAEKYASSSGWQFSDGNYEIQAVALDSSGKTSGTASRSFVIDNSAPVLVLTKPTTIGSNTARAYGRTVQLEGTFSENCSSGISKLTVSFYDKDGEKLFDSEFSGITDMSNANPLVIAQYYDEGEEPLETSDNYKKWVNYKKLFGEENISAYRTNNENLTSQLYFSVTATDAAKIYNDFENQTSEEGGNSTSLFYRGTTAMLNLVNAKNSGFPDFSVASLKNYLNKTDSTYLENEEIEDILLASQSVSVSTENCESISDFISNTNASNGSVYLTFSVNPKNNPTYTVNGLSLNLNSEDDENYTDGYYNYYSDSTINVSIVPGLDLTNIETSSVSIFYNKVGDSEKKLLWTWNEATALKYLMENYAVSESEARTRLSSDPSTYRYTKTESDENTDTLKKTTSLSATNAEIVFGKIYEFSIEGKDIDGQSIISSDNDGYGFFAKSNTAAPVITIGTENKAEYQNLISLTAIKSEVASAGKINFAGTTSTSAELTDSQMTCTVTISDTTSSEKTASETKVITATLRDDTQYLYDWNFALTLTEEMSNLISTGSGLYTAIVEFEANNGSKASVSRTYYLDTISPTISNVAISTGYTKDSTIYINNNAKFTLTGTTTDNYTLNSTSFVFNGVDSEGKAVSAPSSDEERIKSEISWSAEKIDLSAFAPRDGIDAILTVIATDSAGNSTSKEYNVEFDTTAPSGKHKYDKKNKDIIFRVGESNNELSELTAYNSEITELDSELDKDVGGKYAAGTWGNSQTITIRGDWTEDGSGVKMIYYKVFEAEPTESDISNFEKNYATDKSGYFAPSIDDDDKTKRVSYTDSEGNKKFAEVASSFKTTISGLNTGNNYLLLVAVDNVGNAGIDTLKALSINDSGVEENTTWNKSLSSFSLNVDTESPTLSSTKTGSHYTNGVNNLTIGGKIADNDSGVSEVSVTLNGNTISAILSDTDEDGMKDTWEATLEASGLLSKLISGNTYNVNASVTDVAGNASSLTIFTLQIDKESPTVKMTSPSVGSTINNKISVSGTVPATNIGATPEKLELYWCETEPTANTKIGEGLNKVGEINEASSIYSWSISDFDSYEVFGEDTTTVSKQIYLVPVVYDEAGNCNIYTEVLGDDGTTLTRTYSYAAADGNAKYFAYTVDRNSDRPVLLITSIDKASDWSGSKTLKGTISDDDGISEFYISESTNFSDSDKVEVTNGTWSKEFSEEGTKNLYFKIVDAGEKTFTTASSDVFSRPYYKFSGTKDSEIASGDYGLDNSTPITIQIDTAFPKIGTPGLTIGQNSDGLYTVSQISSENTASDKIFGISRNAGGNSKYINIFVPVFDANLSEVNLSVTDSNEENVTKNFKIVSSDGTTSEITDESLVLTATAQTLTVGSGDDAVTYTYYTSGVLDVSSVETGTVSVTFSVTDLAGNKTSESKQFTVDNTGPDTITITSPGETDEVTGTVNIVGTASDMGSGIDSIEWMVPKFGYGDKSDEELIALSDWSDSNNTKTVSVFNFQFTAGSTNDLSQYDNKDNYDVDLNEATKIYTIPIFFKTTDKLGNVYIKRDYYITHNPDADRPVTALSYPTASDYDEKTDEAKFADNKYITLSGVIRASGTVEIPSGTTTVGQVFIQLGKVTYTDGSATVDWSSTNFADEIATLGGAVTPVNAGTADNPKYTLTVGDTTYSTTTYLSSDWWGIPVTTKTSTWNVSLNTKENLDPSSTGDTNNIAIRACAINADGKMGLWTDATIDPVYIHVDTGAPSQSAAMRQYASYSGTSEENVKVEKDYIAEMYLRGKWYLIVTLKDNDTINDNSITVKQGSAPCEYDSTNVADGTGVNAGYKIKTLYIPVDTTAMNTSSVSYTVYVEDESGHSSTMTYTFYIDNTAPELDSLFKGSSLATDNSNLLADNAEISDSNYIFTLGGKVSEAGSGFDKVLFYYVRDGEKSPGVNYTTPSILDSFVTSSQSDAKSVIATDGLTTISVNDNDSLKLYGKQLTGGSTTATSTDGTYTFTHSEISENTAGNQHIRKGGLIYIGGDFGKITGISGTTVTFTSDVAILESNSAQAFFPYAQSVDNTGTESVTKSTGKDFEFSTATEDDGMPETIEGSKAVGFTWTATMHTTNIPDGPAKVVILAFDKAGNVSKTERNVKIVNNAPRLAKVYLGTDLNSNGKWASNEFEAFDVYNAAGSIGVTTSGVKEKQAITTGGFKIKNKLAVAAEIVGGNTSVEMVYKKGASDTRAVTTENGTSGTSATFGSGVITNRLNSVTYNNAENSTALYGFTLASDSVDDGTNENKTMGASFTFWDATDETTQGIDSQNCVLYVSDFYVDLTDDVVPKAKVNPFYWASSGINSLYYEDSTAKGHIELESDLPSDTFTATSGEYDLDPKVSGKITFTGTAYDNTALQKIEFSFTGFDSGNRKTLATYDAENESWNVSNSTISDGFEVSIVSGTSDENGYFSDSTYFGQGGHQVYWTVNFDTEKISTVAAADAKFTVYVTDLAGKISAQTEDEYYQVDVVPYITGVTTTLSKLKTNNPSVYNRTARGHYPVAADETVTFEGFNLGDTKTLAVSTLTASRAYDFAVTYTEEGAEVKVYALNNKNNNDAKGEYDKTVDLKETPTGDKSVYDNYYNRQPNGDNNNLLTDDVYFDVWQITPQAVTPKSGYATQPVMAINPSSHDVGFAFVNSTLYYSMPNGTTNSYKTWIGGYDFWTSVGLAYDSAGHAYGTAAGGDIADNRADTFRIMTSRWGASDTSVNGYNNGKNNYRLEFIAQADYDSAGTCTRNFNKERVRSPSLATTGATATSANVYLAYYDEINDEIRFKSGTITNTTQKDWYTNRKTDEQKATFFGDYYGVTSGDYKSESNGKDTLEGHNGDYRLTHNSLIAGQTTNKYTKAKSDGDVGTTTNAYSMTTAVMTNETTPKPVYAGKYVSIAAIENGGDIPDGGSEKDDAVIAVWWDAENSQLLYSYNLTPKSIKVGQYSQADTKWTTPVAIFGAGNSIGEYCKVAVDKNNGVHVAAYDGLNGDLWYAYVSDFDNPSGAKTCIVDSYGIIGTELNIDVALDASGNPVPYISYYAGSCARPKIAYWAGTESIATSSLIESADDEVFTGAWEVSIVPTSSKVSVDHINVGVWKDSDGKLNWSTNDGNAPTSSNVGTTAPGTNDGKVYGNGSKNPVLGYAITQGSKGYIETAQMK